LKLVESEETKINIVKDSKSVVKEACKLGFMTKQTILDKLLLFPASEE